MYESDITRFLKELKSSHPEINEEQRRGRALWWDKQLDPDTQKRFRESRVAQSAYVYQTKA